MSKLSFGSIRYFHTVTFCPFHSYHTTGHFYKSHDFWGLKFPGRIPETGKIENICESNEPALL